MFIHKEPKKQHKLYGHNSITLVTAGSLYKYLVNWNHLILEYPLLLTKSCIYYRGVIRGGIYSYKESLQFESAQDDALLKEVQFCK